MNYEEKVLNIAKKIYLKGLSKNMSGEDLAIYMFIKGMIFGKRYKEIEIIEDKIKELEIMKELGMF